MKLRGISLIWLLLGVDFLDEAAGVTSVAAPDIQGDFGISYTMFALLVFTVPQVVGTMVEPPFYVLAERFRRKTMVVGGLFAMGLGLAAMALTNNIWLFGGAIIVAWVASGVGVNLAQAALMAARPDQREILMGRWVFMGTLGDLAAPLLVAGLAWASLGWRAALWVIALSLGVYALVLSRQQFPERPDREGEDEPPLLTRIRVALSNRRLLLWAFGVHLCGLMDETLVAFGSMFLELEMGFDLATRGLLWTTCGLGGLVGLGVTEVLLARGFSPLKVMSWAGLGCAAAFVAWLSAQSPIVSGLWLFVMGAGIAPLYPVAKAQAYRAFPESGEMVLAVCGLFGPLELLMPLIMGQLADRVGLVPALSVVLLQPIGLALIALVGPERERAV